MAIVLKGGKIITAEKSYDSDIRIEGEKIASIGKNLAQEGDKVVDATGCYLLPGGIDPHTHLELDTGSTVTADDFESGTKAAIVGGTTTIIDFATQNKGETLKEALENWHRKADNKCYCDYGFHMAITEWNKGISDEMKDMVDNGVPSFKMYMAYKNTLQVDDGAIYEALKRSNEINGLLGFHCENGDVIDILIKENKEKGNNSPKYHALSRPLEIEREAINRAVTLAEIAKAPVYVVHLSSKVGLKCALEARKRGVEVYLETCPQYLLLDDSCYGEEGDFNGAKYVMSPPLRKEGDKEAMWEGLKHGDIDTVATDHCSFNFKGQKELGIEDFSKIPNGAPGIEHRVSLLYTYGVCENKISLNQWVELTSTKAAKLFGMYPRKGAIEIGSDADIVVFDANYTGVIKAENQTQNVDYTPYEGFNQKGRIKQVYLRGTSMVEDSKLVSIEPKGSYISRKPFYKKGSEACTHLT